MTIIIVDSVYFGLVVSRFVSRSKQTKDYIYTPSWPQTKPQIPLYICLKLPIHVNCYNISLTICIHHVDIDYVYFASCCLPHAWHILGTEIVA